MTRRMLYSRLGHIATHIDPPVAPSFRSFAEAVIRFGGHEPTPASVEQLARWYAGGYRGYPLID